MKFTESNFAPLAAREAVDPDWPVGAAGFEPLHLEIRSG